MAVATVIQTFAIALTGFVSIWAILAFIRLVRVRLKLLVLTVFTSVIDTLEIKPRLKLLSNSFIE
nr:MAG TPA: hypothetical protein [Bacteriophage sp.]